MPAYGKVIRVKFLVRLLILLVLSTAAAEAAAPPDSLVRKRTLCVADVRALGPSSSLGPEAAGAIGARIVETGRYQVVERTQMETILKEQSFEQTACSGDDCVVKMGQLLGVDWMVAGDVGELPGGFSINLRLLEVASGRIRFQKHDVYVGDVRTFLVQRLPELADQMLAGKPEKILTDSVIEMVEGDVRMIQARVIPENASQETRLQVDGKKVEQLLPLQIHALQPGTSDLLLISRADTTLRRSIAVHVAPDIDARARARKSRIRWGGTVGSALVAIAGATSGYLNNLRLREAQSDYDVAPDAASVRAARNRMKEKESYRNLSYGAGLAGLAGIVGFQVLF